MMIVERMNEKLKWWSQTKYLTVRSQKSVKIHLTLRTKMAANSNLQIALKLTPRKKKKHCPSVKRGNLGKPRKRLTRSIQTLWTTSLAK
jgi:hypothetical protein